MSLHEFRVAGRAFCVGVYYLDHIKSKDGKTSLIDFSTQTSGHGGAVVIFLEVGLVFQEDLVVKGIYHAIKDKLVHRITASEDPVLNILMHSFSTSQIGAIKQGVVPRSFHEPGGEINGVVLFIVTQAGEAPAVSGIWGSFSSLFSCDLVQPGNARVAPDAASLRAWSNIHAIAPGSTGQAGRGEELAVKAACARMAVFSLSMQQKH